MQLKEQFIHGLNDNNMLIEIICNIIAVRHKCSDKRAGPSMG